ncbi:ABC transporter permease [Mangrovactinospora gilvigrisea]|uniref:ABC transporter permease n=1 Tax=Mangrovactinospora gilvigrisea TaxID=1428644 RepID=A0A1J7C800_9ACTN|nr:ABC-2 family transporter protein [Mangrovactinospora gilvigrisea]OIV37648.1 ABC transporter permease [Mangrovactinospora gilvigrisea]
MADGTTAANPIPRRRAYRLLLGAALRAQLQYRSNTLLTLAGGIAYQGVGLAFVSVLVGRFGAIGGWSLGEIAFLYGLRVTAHGLWMIPTSQLFVLDLTIRTGEFDRYLTRPAGPLMQLLSREVYLATIGDLLTGVAILVAGASQVDLDTSPGALLYLALAVVGGALVEGSLQLAAASLSFRMLSNQSLRLFIDGIMNNFGGYPLKIFPSVTRIVLTFVVPVAFVAYLPANVLLHRTGELALAPWVAWCAPLAGPLLIALAYLVWRTQIRHYQSSGT